MPFYEYRCSACGFEDTLLENHSAPRSKTCPQCKKRGGFKRLISAAGFQLKGDGWYVTDFRDKNRKKEKEGKEPEAKKDSDSAKPSDAADGKKTEDKKTDKKEGASKTKAADAKPDKGKSK